MSIKAKPLRSLVVVALTSAFLLPSLPAEDDLNVDVCEERLKAINIALRKYVEQKGEGRYFPEKLSELAKLRLVDRRNGLVCPANDSPQMVEGIPVGYQSAFDAMDEKLDNQIPSVWPLVWDKVQTHQGVNLVLLADGRILRIREEAYFTEFVGGWANGNYLKKRASQAKESSDLLTMIREEPENLNLDEALAKVAARGPGGLPDLFRELAWSVPEQQSFIVSVVRRIGEPAEELLLGELKSRDAFARQRALHLLKVLGSKAAEERFLKMLEMQYHSVRLQGIDSLGALQLPSSVPVLLEIAQSKEEPADARKCAIIALAKFAGKEARPAFMDAAKNGDLETRLAVAKGLARMKDPAALPHLGGLYKEVDTETQLEVLGALSSMGSKDALRNLRAALRPEVGHLERSESVMRLIRAQQLREFLPDVVPLLNFGHPDVQESAARTLAELGKRSVLPELRKKAEEKKSHKVRAAVLSAIATLEEYGPTEVGKEALRTGDTARITAEKAPFYKGKSVQATLTTGQLVEVVKSDTGWLAVRAYVAGEKRSGWLAESLATLHYRPPKMPFIARVNAQDARIMVGQKLITTMPVGSLVTVTEQRGGWFSVVAARGRWEYSGWMPAGEIAPPAGPNERLLPTSFELRQIAGLPRFGEAGISFIAFTLEGERYATASRTGRLEVRGTATGEKRGGAKVKGRVLALAYHPKRISFQVATNAQIVEYLLGEGLKWHQTYPWVRKDLRAAYIMPVQGRGIFPYDKKGEKGDILWRTALEVYERDAGAMGTPEEIPPEAPPLTDEPEATPAAEGPPKRRGPPRRKPGGQSDDEDDGESEEEDGDDDEDSETATRDDGLMPRAARDLSSGAVQLPEASRIVQSVAATPHGVIALAVRPSTIDVINTSKREVLGKLETGSSGLGALAISPNHLCAATGGTDGLVRIWALGTQRLQAIFKPNSGKIALLAFAPDSQLIAVATVAGKLQFWDLFSRKMLQEIEHQGVATAMEFSPDGKTLIVGNSDCTIGVYAR